MAHSISSIVEAINISDCNLLETVSVLYTILFVYKIPKDIRSFEKFTEVLI